MPQDLNLLIETDELEASLGKENLLIIDLCRESVYQQAHVPGAIFLDFKKLLGGEQPASGKIPSAESLSEVFSLLGLKQNTHVVTYDDEGGGWAGRLIWTLDVIGHQHYSYLNGGIHAWIADNKPVEQNINQATPSQYEATINSDVLISKEELLNSLGDDQLAIWDARSKEEYSGQRSFAARAGHIPGAKHFEWTSGMDKDNALRIRPKEALIAELRDIGITSEKSIVTHCQTHHRSGFTYLLGKILGFPNIKAYDGSWSEWGNDPNTPIETN